MSDYDNVQYDRIAKQLHKIADERDRLFDKNKALKASRDELLEFLVKVDKEDWLDGEWWTEVAPLIQKAQAQKEKETK